MYKGATIYCFTLNKITFSCMCNLGYIQYNTNIFNKDK